MLFSSILFLFTFLPVTLILYYLAPGKLKNVVLLAASLVFYAWGEPVYVLLMIFSILFNYVIGMDVHATWDTPGRPSTHHVYCSGEFVYAGIL